MLSWTVSNPRPWLLARVLNPMQRMKESECCINFENVLGFAQ